jgi:1,2-diacylglycerol 3-alpha-glucosyltransferase
VHIGILTDYPVVTFANGPALATQALKRYLEQRGHRVTIVGPKPGHDEPAAQPGSLLFSSLNFAAHPGVRMPLPWPPRTVMQSPGFDVIHSHANSLVMHWPALMRELHGTPSIATNTIYLPAFAQHMLPDQLYEIGVVREKWNGLADWLERKFAVAYNGGDGLIVQCQGLADYWKDKGLTVPLHVIPRPIDVRNFDRPLGPDPFHANFPRGGRIIVVGRHAREKDLDKVIDMFAKHVLPACPLASLTLIGDGMEHQALVTQARKLGIENRCHLAGEKAHKDLRDWYGHADVFAYASTSETYGQVISEALWCGVPVVAVDDKMGVAFQVNSGEDGLLVPNDGKIVENLGNAAVRLLTDVSMRQVMGERAAVRARQRVAPEVIYAAYERAYDAAQEHLRQNPPHRRNAHKPSDAFAVTKDHLWPWAWKHVAACGIAAFRGGSTYQTPKGMRIDEAPSAGPDATRPLEDVLPDLANHVSQVEPVDVHAAVKKARKTERAGDKPAPVN